MQCNAMRSAGQVKARTRTRTKTKTRIRFDLICVDINSSCLCHLSGRIAPLRHLLRCVATSALRGRHPCRRLAGCNSPNSSRLRLVFVEACVFATTSNSTPGQTNSCCHLWVRNLDGFRSRLIGLITHLD